MAMQGSWKTLTGVPVADVVAFVRENDLWVAGVEDGAERALTTGGSDSLRSGKADWVYYEEVFDRNWQTYWWSPDSRRLAFFTGELSIRKKARRRESGLHQ